MNTDDEVPKTERRTLNITEAARRLGIGRNAAYAAAKTGELATIRIGTRLLVPIEALNQLLRSSEAAHGGRQPEQEQEPSPVPKNDIGTVRRVGRPPRGAMADALDATITFRIDATMKERLQAAADQAERSLSSEIALRLAHSLSTVAALRVSIVVEPAPASES